MAERTVNLTVPDIDAMSDDQLALLLRLRDGRWSEQTKQLLAKFGTDRLNLNRAWAGLWQGWTCPCCGRSKLQIPRLNSAGVLLCQVEIHHDHLRDWAERKFTEFNPRSQDREAAHQIDQAKHAIMKLCTRFTDTPLCLDCNLVEGRAKASLGTDVFADFSFSPREIATFIEVRDNRVHDFDHGKVKALWETLKADVEDRIDFGTRMAKRFANGRNRTQFGGPIAPELWMEPSTIVFALLGDDATRVDVSNLSHKIVARSTSRDAVGRSGRPKQRRPGTMPSEADYRAINEANGGQKHWPRLGEDWTCECCGRAKRAICRRANSGKWTARIHVLRDWKFGDAGPDADQVARDFHILDHEPAFVCQDCRNVISQLQGRDDTLTEESVTLADLRGAIVSVADNQPHEVDFEYLLDRAHENLGLPEAIRKYREIEAIALRHLEEARYFMKRHRCDFGRARDLVVRDYAASGSMSQEETAELVDWYLDRARRFDELKQREMGRTPPSGSV